MVCKYVLPTFASLTVDAITIEHVKDWFASMAERPGSANRAMPILSTMMRMAESCRDPSYGDTSIPPMPRDWFRISVCARS